MWAWGRLATSRQTATPELASLPLHPGRSPSAFAASPAPCPPREQGTQCWEGSRLLPRANGHLCSRARAAAPPLFQLQAQVNLRLDLSRSPSQGAVPARSSPAAATFSAAAASLNHSRAEGRRGSPLTGVCRTLGSPILQLSQLLLLALHLSSGRPLTGSQDWSRAGLSRRPFSGGGTDKDSTRQRPRRSLPPRHR